MAGGEEATVDRRPIPDSTDDGPVTPSSIEADPRARPPKPPEPLLLILAFLWIVMPIVALPVLAATGAPAEPVPTTASIDPNVAPWWELTALPRIGRGVAREIIRYRESAGESPVTGGAAPVFAAVPDLARVRGIGPKTLQRIGPYLNFAHWKQNGR